MRILIALCADCLEKRRHPLTVLGMQFGKSKCEECGTYGDTEVIEIETEIVLSEMPIPEP